MDLNQDIPVTNPKDKNVSPEERHKWRIPELPPVPKDLNHFQQEEVEIYQCQYKNWFMAARQQEWELLKGWKPMSCKGQVQKIKAWLKNQSMLSEDKKKKLAQGRDNTPVEAPQASTRKNPPQPVPNKPKQTPKTNKKGKKKAKGKAKPKWNKPYPQNYRIPKKEKTSMEDVFNMARTLMEFKNKEEERLNQSFPKK
ncbi:hypothetical protein O181_086595 [Austropuccinia psidii MF-1]|uniref:Uncharacterized protein n=1 Tax=Austropuccinia psidii MF-1 TaxID=1389203 RepID=A0A9Q3INC4_9BASI|nr:hypothetical protein [Austropuccinia psidii MF-1]